MTRLTNDARGKIVNMILARKFDPLKEAMNARQYALAHRFYEHLYTAEQRKLFEMAENVLKGPFYRDTSIRVAADGWKLDLYFGPRHAEKGHPTQPSTWAHQNTYDPLVSLAGTSGLGLDFKTFAEDQKALKDHEDELREQVSAQIGAFFTFDKLAEAWREIEPFVRAVERGLAAPVINTPAIVDRSQLNAVLDLPPDEVPTDAIAQRKK